MNPAYLYCFSADGRTAEARSFPITRAYALICQIVSHTGGTLRLLLSPADPAQPFEVVEGNWDVIQEALTKRE